MQRVEYSTSVQADEACVFLLLVIYALQCYPLIFSGAVCQELRQTECKITKKWRNEQAQKEN
ncbi:hypothetical protein HMPREF0673_02688 [Leyella stercorea DSM 18206]|uniref:Uncharacterized protein n=1 Tax=Leyella stercorea DSM 18206 TaxID=1002367 RepID=G6B1B6_9BACT|nr:hypothetical protein HMPREF0673_02688 [Leyella stercorea DSM 18206]